MGRAEITRPTIDGRDAAVAATSLSAVAAAAAAVRDISQGLEAEGSCLLIRVLWGGDMAKYTVVKKGRRAEIQDRKRARHGDPVTGKLRHKEKVASVSLSGKRKRKLFKKWRRDQKEALKKGLVTMEDVEMAVAEGTSRDTSNKSQMKFHLKKGSKLIVKKLKGKGKGRRKYTKPATTAVAADAMVE